MKYNRAVSRAGKPATIYEEDAIMKKIFAAVLALALVAAYATKKED